MLTHKNALSSFRFLSGLRTLAAGAQKSSSLVSKGLLNRGFSKDAKEGKEFREKSPDELGTKELKEATNKELNKLNIKDDGAVDHKLSDNFSNQVKLAEGHVGNGDLMNGAAMLNSVQTGHNQSGQNQIGHNQPSSNPVNQNRNGSLKKKHSTVKENERNIVRTFRTSQELDELIKGAPFLSLRIG